MKQNLKLSFIFLSFYFILIQCGGDGITKVEEDSFKNGKIDTIYYYKKGKLFQKDYDYNGDGTFDTFNYYNDDEKLVKIDADENFDGKFDRKYLFSGGVDKRLLTYRDNNSDGTFDHWIIYDDGNYLGEEKDRNFDGKVDYWIRYKEYDSDYTEKHDDNFDGKFNRVQTYKNYKLVK